MEITRLNKIKVMKKQMLIFLFSMLLPFASRAQKEPISSPQHDQVRPAAHHIPNWLLDGWAARTQDTGTWITDNSAYKSDNETFDAYGLQWEYGLGKKHLKGRLYCIRDGQDIGSVWQFLEFWDPAAGEARIIQIGSDGMVGQGRIWRLDDGSIKEQQTFTSPDGGAFDSGHHSWMEDGKYHTQSFSIEDEQWGKQRYYIWELKYSVK